MERPSEVPDQFGKKSGKHRGKVRFEFLPGNWPRNGIKYDRGVPAPMLYLSRKKKGEGGKL